MPADLPTAAPETGPDHVWSVEVFYWLNFAHPYLKGGNQSIDYEDLTFPNTTQGAPGATLSIPIGQNDIVRATYFEARSNGNTVAPAALDLFGQSIPMGDYLATQYHFRAVKVSLEDVLFPFPRHGAKLHFKSLWEVQYATIATRIDAPLDTTTDTNGYTSYPSATGSLSVILPTFGLAMQYEASKNLRLELRGSAFGIPHHSYLIDSEASLQYTIGHAQLILGGKLYDMKTSPNNTEYFRALATGGFVGLRWLGWPGR